MKYQNLIDELSQNLKAVTPLAGRRRRAVTLILGMAVAVLVIFAFFSLRPDLKDAVKGGQFILGSILCVLGWLLGSYSLSLLQLPTSQNKKYLILSCSAFGLLCLGYVLLGITYGTSHWLENGSSISGARCSVDVVLLSLLPGVLLFLNLRKAAPTMATATGLNIGLCCALLSAFFLQFSCPSQVSSHLLIWHMIVPAVVLCGLGTLLGRFVLKW